MEALVAEQKKVIDLLFAKVFMRNDGILQVDFEEHLLLDIDQCKELNRVYKEEFKVGKVPILHVTGTFMNVTKEARDFAATEEGLESSKAEAFVIHSLAQKILANFYLNINQPSVPTKFFTKEEDAVAWLSSFL